MVGRIVDLSPGREIPVTTDSVKSGDMAAPTPVENGKVVDDDLGPPTEEIRQGGPKDCCVIAGEIISTNDMLMELADHPAVKRVADRFVTIKVKDFLGVTSGTQDPKFSVSCDTTIGEFFIDVSCRYELELGDFDIIYQDKDFAYNLGGLSEDDTLSSLNILPKQDKTYCMSLDLASPKKRKSRSVPQDSSPTVVPTEVVSGAGGDGSLLSAGLEIGAHKRDFVGLKNLNMTCYLNSFLQGLWFTPEFRNGLYNYEYVPEKSNRKSLCLPLQKLFLQLQFSVRDSIDTAELIKTFGWEDRDAWNQHDIEELCSIFMENLTTEFKGSPLDGIIQALYFGTLDDYVKCLECGRVSQRTDDFLVVPLPIRNFGRTLSNPTLESAIESFVAYEVLDGSNMYECSQCEKKCPAHKGLKFNRLPYILTIQLKRFEYDYAKDRRLKLNDRVEFPLILDMNPYIENPSGDRREALKTDLLKPASLSVEGGRSDHSRSTISMTDKETDDVEEFFLWWQDEEEEMVPDDGGAVSNSMTPTEEMLELVKTKGPEIYQLYGVMVHRGGINSGHYYAYILDLERNKWFRCDDSTIRKASVSDIQGAYGGEPHDDRELTSAYMLLYRRFDPELNLLPYYLEEMPCHIQELWKATALVDQQLHEEEELAKNTVRMLILYPVESSPELVEKVVAVPKILSWKEAEQFVFDDVFKSNASPADTVAGNHFRLCRYDRELCIIENSFEGCEDSLIVSVLRNRPPITKNEGFFLEIRPETSSFEQYRQDDVVFSTHLVDCASQEILSLKEIHLQPAQTVDELRSKVAHFFALSDTAMGIVSHHSGQCSTIVGDKHPLLLCKFDKLTNLYVQPGHGDEVDDALLNFVQTYTKAEIIEIAFQVSPGFTGELHPLPVVARSMDTSATSKCDGNASKELDSGDGTTSTKLSHEANVNVVGAGSEPQAASGNDQPKLQVDLPRSQAPKMDFYIKLTNQVKAEGENLVVHLIRIDGQTPLYALSFRLSQLMQIDEKDFVLYKVDRSEITELRRMTDRICLMQPFDRLLVKHEHRLQDDELRVPVFLLNIGCIDNALEFLTEVVAKPKFTVEQLKDIVMANCEHLQGDPNLTTKRLRLRKKIRTNPSKIMRESSRLADLFTPVTLYAAELYLQILDDPMELSDQTFSLCLRLWHSSTGVLDSAVEVTVFHDHSDSLEDIISKKVRESLGIGEEIELEAAKPEVGYPWEVSPRLIQDLSWFSLKPPVKKSLYVYNDELVLFIRDKSEPFKEFDEAELEHLRPRTVLKPSLSTVNEPRREQGLKLNLAKSPRK